MRRLFKIFIVLGKKQTLQVAIYISYIYVFMAYIYLDLDWTLDDWQECNLSEGNSFK